MQSPPPVQVPESILLAKNWPRSSCSGRWRGGGFACFSYNANNKPPSPSNEVGFKAVEATIDEKAEILFLGQISMTAVVLGVIYGGTNTFRPFPDDIFRYDIKEPFKLLNGWLLWAGIDLFGAIISIALAGAAMTFLNGEPPEKETDSLVLLLPLIGSSSLRLPTPVCALVSAAVFALAHLTPG